MIKLTLDRDCHVSVKAFGSSSRITVAIETPTDLELCYEINKNFSLSDLFETSTQEKVEVFLNFLVEKYSDEILAAQERMKEEAAL